MGNLKSKVEYKGYMDESKIKELKLWHEDVENVKKSGMQFVLVYNDKQLGVGTWTMTSSWNDIERSMMNAERLLENSPQINRRIGIHVYKMDVA